MNENNVDIINIDDKEIILIGTAHVSKKSAEQVKEIIEETKPDTVCVELDNERYNSIINEKKWSEMDIFKIIKEKKSLLLLVNLIMGSYQRKMAEQFDIKPGQEMIQGIESAQKINANLVLADRNIQITFKRIWSGLGFWEKLKLITQIITILFTNQEISEKEIDQLKSGDTLTIILAELGESFPGLKKHLIDERDQYLAEKIKNAPGKKIVAVLGAGHIPGTKKELFNDHDLEQLSEVPLKRNFLKFISWTIPLIILGIIAYTLYINRSTGIEQIISWVIWNGSLSALGALIASGHMLTILTSFLIAPISSLNPTLAAGWFAGLVEAVLRKPQVRDFQDLSKDLSFKEFRTNKVIKVLLIVIFANLGSVLGTFIGGADVIRLFIQSIK